MPRKGSIRGHCSCYFKYDAVIAAEAKAEDKAEGKAEGKAEAYQEIAAWNTRRLEAEAKGIRFDEAPPSQNGAPEAP